LLGHHLKVSRFYFHYAVKPKIDAKTNEGTKAGVLNYDTWQKLSFSLGKYTAVFQAEVYAIKTCAVENLDRDCNNRSIYILSDSQAAIKALLRYCCHFC
jgi:hypothetical protein